MLVQFVISYVLVTLLFVYIIIMNYNGFEYWSQEGKPKNPYFLWMRNFADFPAVFHI